MISLIKENIAHKLGAAVTGMAGGPAGGAPTIPLANDETNPEWLAFHSAFYLCLNELTELYIFVY